MAIQINRDPFARASLMRETTRDRGGCSWCGSRRGRFRYWWEDDALRQRGLAYGRTYCSVGCYRADNDQD